MAKNGISCAKIVLQVTRGQVRERTATVSNNTQPTSRVRIMLSGLSGRLRAAPLKPGASDFVSGKKAFTGR